MVKIKSRVRPPEMMLVRATGKELVAGEHRKGTEIVWSTADKTEIRQSLPDELDPDSGLGQQLAAVARNGLQDGIESKDVEGVEAYLLITARRTSGGKFVRGVSAILSPRLVQAAMADSATPDPAATETP